MDNNNNLSTSKSNYNIETGMGQRSSFVSLAEEIVSMNKNAVEITTKLNDIVTSQDSSVSISLTDAQGNKTDYNLPTVGFLKNEIDKVNENIKKLSGLESSTSLIDGKSVRKVYTVDINREPYPIDRLGSVSTFKPLNNHFFESLLNPILSVELDISNKVNKNVNKIRSRRYIIKFERETDFSLTREGKLSYNIFRIKFLNRNDIEINEFDSWYREHSNLGILLDVVDPYDEQDFDISTNEVDSHGLFSVIKTETDSLNRKLWYHLNTLTYYTKNGLSKSLTIGDNLILNKLNSSTRWVIKEISSESSNYKVTLERLEGYDPVPIGVNILSYYSQISSTKRVNISVGFDEYCIVFVKPINTENNVISTLWSKGTCFYTNDLILSTDNTTSLSQYYLSSVYDYGKVLKDLVLKKIPSEYAEKPNKIILDIDDFKVVQINKHLTDTENTRVLRNLHSQKITSKAKVSQLNNAIVEKNKEINTKSYSSVAESNAAKNELTKLISEQERETKTLSSTVSQIGTKVKESQSGSKFRVRGFWTIPQPIFNGITEPQHIIQFRVQYRYSSKSGEINQTEGFKIKTKTNQETSDNSGRVVLILPDEQETTSTITTTTTTMYSGGGGTAAVVLKGNIKSSKASKRESPDADKTAYFSNWNEFKTDVRKRYWDSERGIWYWKIEDVEDADTPNINQLDIPIQQNEKVEIRIKCISEVGWPDALVESDWSDILTIEFPDELDDVLNSNEFILKEAMQDETIVSMDSNLNSKGVYKHLEESFYDNKTYYAHTDRGIQSSFKDEFGKNLNIYEYLDYLTKRVKSLEDLVNRSKGEFSVYIHTPETTLPVKSGNVYKLVVELEDYCERSGTTRSYYNNVSLIDNYFIEIKNTSSSSMLLLSNRKYENNVNNTFYQFNDNKPLTINYNNDMYTQFDYQWIWISDNSNGEPIYSGITNGDYAPSILNSDIYNIGWSSGISEGFFDYKFNIIDDIVWYDNSLPVGSCMATVHPKIYNSSDIVESGTDKSKIISGNSNEIIPIYIYYKLDGSLQDNQIYNVPTSEISDKKYRKIKFFIEPEILIKPFEFEIEFTLKQFRDIMVNSIPISNGVTNTSM